MALPMNLLVGLLMVSSIHARDTADGSKNHGFLSKHMPSRSKSSRSSIDVNGKFMAHNLNRKELEGRPEALSDHNVLADVASVTGGSSHPDGKLKRGGVIATPTDDSPFTTHSDEPVHPTVHTEVTMDFTSARAGTFRTIKEEDKAVQQLLTHESNSLIGFFVSGFILVLLSFAAMIGVRMRRGVQPAIALASSGRHGIDMSISMAIVSDNQPNKVGQVEKMSSQDRQRQMRCGTFGQSMDNVTLPSGLQSLTFGDSFNQSMDNVTLSSGLQSLTFGSSCNQSAVFNVTLTSIVSPEKEARRKPKRGAAQPRRRRRRRAAATTRTKAEKREVPEPPDAQKRCVCGYCGAVFASRSKLFRHLREANSSCRAIALSHGMPLENPIRAVERHLRQRYGDLLLAGCIVLRVKPGFDHDPSRKASFYKSPRGLLLRSGGDNDEVRDSPYDVGDAPYDVVIVRGTSGSHSRGNETTTRIRGRNNIVSPARGRDGSLSRHRSSGRPRPSDRERTVRPFRRDVFKVDPNAGKQKPGFPKGKIEPMDRTILAAALRETWEEAGLAADQLRALPHAAEAAAKASAHLDDSARRLFSEDEATLMESHHDAHLAEEVEHVDEDDLRFASIDVREATGRRGKRARYFVCGLQEDPPRPVELTTRHDVDGDIADASWVDVNAALMLLNPKRRAALRRAVLIFNAHERGAAASSK